MTQPNDIDEFSDKSDEDFPAEAKREDRKRLAAKLGDSGLELMRAAVGAGGSAVVHQAKVLRSAERLPAVGTVVAVKQYKPELLAEEGQLKRVQQEADIGDSFNSPNLVRTYGLLPSKAAPQFLVMEWIEGRTLADMTRDPAAWSVDRVGLDGTLPPDLTNYFEQWEWLQRIALGLVDGLEAMHKKGVFHRDLKPENVMVRRDSTPVIMDIGVAELATESAESLHTKMGQFLGSIRYASPQYLVGEAFTAADDVYGLGTILFELFSGREMFDGHKRKTSLPILISQVGQPVDSVRPAVPAPIKVLLQAIIHRDRARRPQLVDIRAALEDPAGSPFISSELERQSAEQRGFQIVRILDNGMAFLADLGGTQLSVDSEYTVVRRSSPLLVPSLTREITPEEWVGTARLKHAFQNVGHFIPIRKQWKQPQPQTITMMSMLDGIGHWVDDSHQPRKICLGDWVLKGPVKPS